MKQPNNMVNVIALSGDGRFVLLSSMATNLVPHDRNRCPFDPGLPEEHPCIDLFVKDMQSGNIEQVSVSSGGRLANGDSEAQGDISADGRYVAFSSMASNLVPGDTNTCRYGFNMEESIIAPCSDVFVRDRRTGKTSRVSVSSSGEQGNHTSYGGSISDDGRFVVFSSFASNLVAGDTNKCESPESEKSGTCSDVFLHDRRNGTTARISVTSEGVQSRDSSLDATISSDGRYVAFRGVGLASGEEPGVFLRDVPAGKTKRISVDLDYSHPEDMPLTITDAKISHDGSTIIYDDSWSSYIYDRTSGATKIFEGRLGRQISAKGVSYSGRFVVLSTIHDSQADHAPGDDCFLVDRRTGEASLFIALPLDQDGIESCAISGDGKVLGFFSLARLVPDDTNRFGDAYLRYGATGRIVRASQP